MSFPTPNDCVAEAQAVLARRSSSSCQPRAQRSPVSGPLPRRPDSHGARAQPARAHPAPEPSALRREPARCFVPPSMSWFFRRGGRGARSAFLFSVGARPLKMLVALSPKRNGRPTFKIFIFIFFLLFHLK